MSKNANVQANLLNNSKVTGTVMRTEITFVCDSGRVVWDAPWLVLFEPCRCVNWVYENDREWCLLRWKSLLCKAVWCLSWHFIHVVLGEGNLWQKDILDKSSISCALGRVPVWLAGDTRWTSSNEIGGVLSCRKDKSALVRFDLRTFCLVVCWFLLMCILVAVLLSGCLLDCLWAYFHRQGQTCVTRVIKMIRLDWVKCVCMTHCYHCSFSLPWNLFRANWNKTVYSRSWWNLRDLNVSTNLFKKVENSMKESLWCVEGGVCVRNWARKLLTMMSRHPNHCSGYSIVDWVPIGNVRKTSECFICFPCCQCWHLRHFLRYGKRQYVIKRKELMPCVRSISWEPPWMVDTLTLVVALIMPNFAAKLK